MKQTKLAFLAMTLAVLVTVSGCGGQAKPTGTKATMAATMESLLVADYEVEYIFRSAGLAVDSTKPVARPEGGTYFPVQSDQYKTTADLKKLLAATYATDEVVARVLATPDANGNPLYLDIEGALCRSSEPAIAPMSPEITGKDIAMGEQGKVDGKKTQHFTVLEKSPDGGEAVATLAAMEGKGGKWLLAEQRSAAARNQTKTGVGMAVPEGELGKTAQVFLDALTSGDVATLETMVLDPGSYESTFFPTGSYSYANLARAGITSATITGVVQELDYQAEYQVTLEVALGNETFPTGSSRWRMMVSQREIGLIVSQFYPEDKTPYLLLPEEEQTSNAVNQVNRLMQLQGAISFGSPGDLPAAIVTEYALMELSYANPESYGGFTAEQVTKEALKLFGFADFKPDPSFYNEETKSYIIYGRDGEVFNARLTLLQEGNGVATVEARHYSDPLQINASATVVYTLKNNWNGTYEFVSAVMTPV